MGPLELILRPVGVVLLVLVAVLLLRARRRDHTALAGVGLCLSVAAFLLTSMPGASRFLGVLVYPLTALCSTHPVWFWLFCTALFSDGFKLTRRHAEYLGVMAVVGALYQWMWSSELRNQSPALFEVLGMGFGLASLVFVCLGPLTVFAGERTDLDERRRRIRTWFVPLTSVYLAIVVVTQVFRVLAGEPTAHPLVIANLAIIAVLAAVALFTFVQMRVVNWLDLAEAPGLNVVSLSRVEQSVLERVNRRLIPERLYAREALTIATLAGLLETQEHILRRVINRGLGFRNFNDFLHSHRLREAGVTLRDPAQRRIPVLTVALEVGYGSIGPFNRAFKERFGVTPTEYRRAAANGTLDRDSILLGEPASTTPHS